LKLIVCLSEDLGMMFNHRRQSRDRVLIADMIAHTQGKRLWISPYSEELFGDACSFLHISPDPIANAEADDYCFVEDTPLPRDLNCVDELIIYRWNRHYPSDVHFACDKSAFRLAERTDFAGSSHDNITKEIWKK
jgi:hypothetical protein